MKTMFTYRLNVEQCEAILQDLKKELEDQVLEMHFITQAIMQAEHSRRQIDEMRKSIRRDITTTKSEIQQFPGSSEITRGKMKIEMLTSRLDSLNREELKVISELESLYNSEVADKIEELEYIINDVEQHKLRLEGYL